jgi:ATP-dependent phosphoenolpyruvate carboxykinase
MLSRVADTFQTRSSTSTTLESTPSSSATSAPPNSTRRLLSTKKAPPSQAYPPPPPPPLKPQTGALSVRSGKLTGRSPKDKRIVDEPSSNGNVWWGSVNIKLAPETFRINRERAIDYLNIQEQLYVFDGFAGWHPSYRIKVRVVCTRAYHGPPPPPALLTRAALFMNNMLIRPTAEELRDFGAPDYTIYNAGAFPANRYTKEMTSATSVAIDFSRREMVILGTQYAGEMKKVPPPPSRLLLLHHPSLFARCAVPSSSPPPQGVFTVMNYLMPLQGVLSLHSSANEGPDGTVTLFFGLSGTGKTTLSADPKRALIGDDEHCWCDDGVFNIEGGCYAKCIGLSRDKEPQLYDAIRFGTVVENGGGGGGGEGC